MPTLLKESRIHVNRNLKLSSVKAIGFDLDHTLLLYHHHATSRLIHQEAFKKLKNGGSKYKLSRPFPYKPDASIRGLLIDKKRGNLIKVDRHRYVVLARHGFKKLNDAERRRIYANEKISLNNKDGYASVDTLFEVSEALLYCQMVAHLDRIQKRPDYSRLYKDVRSAVDLSHRDGSIKGRILARPYKFFIKDFNLPDALLHLKRGGKKLFLLTDSEWYYTNEAMGYLLNGERDGVLHWTDYFDAVFVSAGKPGFYTCSKRAVPLENPDSATPVRIGGNRKDLEKILGLSGDQILYFGDHTFSDILGSKKRIGWRTAMILPELDRESSARVIAASAMKDPKIEKERRRLEGRLTDLYVRVRIYRNTKAAPLYQLNPTRLKEQDKKRREIFNEIVRLEKKLTDLLTKTQAAAEREWRRPNPYWGSPFSAGNDKSLFAEQIRDYACVYTARVSNLLYYGTNHFFEVKPSFLPHEEE